MPGTKFATVALVALCLAAGACRSRPQHGGASAAGAGFAVTPYLQNPSQDAMTLVWFSDGGDAARVSWWRADGQGRRRRASVAGRPANALAPRKGASPPPFKYRVRLDGLEPSAEYRYEVRLRGGAAYTNAFSTAPAAGSGTMRFVAYADSETQPSSTGDRVSWENPAEDGDTNAYAAVRCRRRYYIDQTDGYASNIVSMAAFGPDLTVIAGDIVQTGSEQSHWDEFWRHNAGDINDRAGATPIFAAPGNHDYASYSAERGGLFGEAGMAKFLTYFESNPNGASNPMHEGRYHRLDWGPATFIAIDCNNGPDDDFTKGLECRDTNFWLRRDTSAAPDFNEGSEQWRWLERQLDDARRKSKFTFMVSHHCPYSVGYHGRIPGEQGLDRTLEPERLSGAPTRRLASLAMKYGVDAWICGHDELYEHSVLKGNETMPDGTTRPHELHIYDVGVGGDGLRGCRRTQEPNPYEVFRAHVDAPEIYDERGILVEGGKHYGHLEGTISQAADGVWQAELRMAYVFVTTNGQGRACGFETRHYPDGVILREKTGSH